MATRRTTLVPRTTRQTSRTAPSASSSNSRAQSAQANPNTRRPEPAHVAQERADAPQPKTPHANGSKEDAETNIRVVIRCRRRSEREVQENSPIIVSTNGRKNQEITIETAAPVSSLGVITLPPTRTYPFDLVFGPEADQSDIYHDVVSPMLVEVMQGYNCTLFAYGQTGTGKTYTMQGDLTPTPMGNPSAQAGMIPRVLFRLFHELESSNADYSVKISFVELYNEELRDLLASELAAPIGTAQPMGMGAAKDKDGAGQLKIFDDASKKGVFIQGLEECCVKDASDALALLTKGSERRQIAATKFNDHSSRSHSVFSITVHIKETSSIGDDLLKIGKLNLVDLAGSENIGRSGAENKRAREAGMINQSLLTLGRVINALVDRSSHVPYRESKLTRLLQDSLGGRTKTCIIATISPARSNMEETLSTLDYAIRAKSIRNKPEMNQRMTRNALLKEYVAEIERLKADVMAAREKNGIFFSEETWQQMTAEQELKDTNLLEAKKQVDIIENQLRNVREEFEQSLALLMRRDGELKETKEKLQKKETELVVTEGHLKATKGVLEEEIVVRQAYQENEGVLDNVATGLKTVAHQSVDDLGRLFGKLERKSSVFNSNIQAVSSNTRMITTESRTAAVKLDDFVKLSNKHVSNVKLEVDQYRAKELESLASISAKMNQQLDKFQEILKTIRSKEEASEEGMERLQTTVGQTQDDIKAAFETWADDVRGHCESTCQEAEAAAAASYSAVEKAFKSVGSLTETVLQETQDYVAAERKSLQEAKAMADSATQAEVARLQSQNVVLNRALESERVKAERAKDELVKRMIGLFDTFMTERARSLRETFSELVDSNKEAETGMAKLGKEQGHRLESAISRGKELSGSLDKRAGESKRLRDGAFKALGVANSSLRDGYTNVEAAVSSSVSGFSDDLQRRVQQADLECTEVIDDLRRVKRARVDAVDTLAIDVSASLRSTQRSVSTTSEHAETMTNKVASEVNGLTSAIDAYRSVSSLHLSEIYNASQLLSNEGAREDMPTGTTPRKRAWEYSDHWSLTKSRDVLVKEWRSRGGPSSRPDTSLADHSSLLEESEPEAENAALSPDAANAGDDPATEDEQDTTITMNSPPIKSLASPALSASSVPEIPPLEIRKSIPVYRSALPVKGTLTERSTNVLAGRPATRRTRQ